jgi:hypothetical protein
MIDSATDGLSLAISGVDHARDISDSIVLARCQHSSRSEGMQSWLSKLRPLHALEADRADVVPPMLTKIAKDDEDKGPPNLRAATPMSPQCGRCTNYTMGLRKCNKYQLAVPTNAVCDDFEQGEAAHFATPSIKLGASLNPNPLPPIKPVGSGMPGGNGPPVPNNQLPPNTRKPSVVAQLAAEKGNPIAANLYNMFNPPVQQQQPGMPKAANLGMMALSTGLGVGVNALKPKPKKKKPVQIEDEEAPVSAPESMPKIAAVHAMGDPIPKDWNGCLTLPNKQNGGIPSFGREAWDSMSYARRKGSDKNNFDKAWFTELGKQAALPPDSWVDTSPAATASRRNMDRWVQYQRRQRAAGVPSGLDSKAPVTAPGAADWLGPTTSSQDLGDNMPISTDMFNDSRDPLGLPGGGGRSAGGTTTPAPAPTTNPYMDVYRNMDMNNPYYNPYSDVGQRMQTAVNLPQQASQAQTPYRPQRGTDAGFSLGPGGDETTAQPGGSGVEPPAPTKPYRPQRSTDAGFSFGLGGDETTAQPGGSGQRVDIGQPYSAAIGGGYSAARSPRGGGRRVNAPRGWGYASINSMRPSRSWSLSGGPKMQSSRGMQRQLTPAGRSWRPARNKFGSVREAELIKFAISMGALAARRG